MRCIYIRDGVQLRCLILFAWNRSRRRYILWSSGQPIRHETYYRKLQCVYSLRRLRVGETLGLCVNEAAQIMDCYEIAKVQISSRK